MPVDKYFAIEAHCRPGDTLHDYPELSEVVKVGAGPIGCRRGACAVERLAFGQLLLWLNLRFRAAPDVIREAMAVDLLAEIRYNADKYMV